jgi:hypothetical protein
MTAKALGSSADPSGALIELQAPAWSPTSVLLRRPGGTLAETPAHRTTDSDGSVSTMPVRWKVCAERVASTCSSSQRARCVSKTGRFRGGHVDLPSLSYGHLVGDSTRPAWRGTQGALVRSDRRFDAGGDVCTARAAAGRSGDGLRDRESRGARHRRAGHRSLAGVQHSGSAEPVVLSIVADPEPSFMAADPCVRSSLLCR